MTALELTAADRARLNGEVTAAVMAKSKFDVSELRAELRRALPRQRMEESR